MDYEKDREVYFGKEPTDEEIDAMIEEPPVSEEELIKQLNASRLFWKRMYFRLLGKSMTLPSQRNDNGE